MSQDLFNYRRPAGAPPLQSIDHNSVHNSVHNPGTNGLKRTASGSRRSFAPRLSALPQRSHTRSSSGNGNMSMDMEKENFNFNPNFNSGKRGSSLRPHSGFPVPQTTRDPRPLRDKQYQTFMQDEILSFLQQNRFEIEAKHPVGPKNLKSPTQKDFTLIFQWLYKRIDPGYKFTKPFEHEVYFILRSIAYPYLDSINKSQIAAVGGQNWPVYLGVLHWLVELNESMDKFDVAACGNSATAQINQLVTEYFINSYAAYMADEDIQGSGNSGSSGPLAELETALSALQGPAAEAEARIKAENAELEARMNELGTSAASVAAAEKKARTLEGDIEKFAAFTALLQSKRNKTESTIRSIEEEMRSVRELQLQYSREKEKLETEMANLGIRPSEIDKLRAEQAQLEAVRTEIIERHGELAKRVNSAESGARTAVSELNRLVEMYNLRITKLRPIVARFGGAVANSELEVTLDDLLAAESLGKTPVELLKGRDLRRDVREPLQKLRDAVAAAVHADQDESLKVQEALDLLCEKSSDRKEKVEMLEARLNSEKIAYEELYETTSGDLSASNAEIERLERELNQMSKELQKSHLGVEQRVQTAAMEFNRLERSIKAAREAMHREVQGMIEFIINFKLHVQASLESHESFLLSELEGKEDAEMV